MNKRLLTYFYIVLGLGLMLAFPAWADFQTGADAYERGEYNTALAEFRPLAEQGDAVAQYNVGIMYDFGLGVSEDDREAVKWYE